MGPSRLSSREVAPVLAHHHRLSLPGSCRAFQRALTSPASDPGWHERVSTRLRQLRRAFTEHTALTEGPHGLYAELLDNAPRLTRGVRVMLGEHATVGTALAALQQRVDGAAPTVDELRHRAGELLRQLARHRQRGADLLYQAYATDIGGET
jgi:hypothetical protein